MKILVLGGTGSMGVHLVNILKEENEIYVTSRKEHKNKKNVNYIKGNAKDLEFISRLLKEDWDVIIDFMVYKLKEFEERYNLFLSSSKHYLFLSSARVYNHSKDKIKENSPRLLETSTDLDFLNTDDYSLEKARQENMLKNSDNSNWTIIRPYITFSENRIQLGILEKEDWLYRALKGRTIIFSEDIAKSITTLTYGYDVSLAISRLVGKEKKFFI